MKANRRIVALTACCVALCLTLGACSSAQSGQGASAGGDGGAQVEAEAQPENEGGEPTSNGTGQDADKAETTTAATPSADDPYTSDEACLSCHGGTYEALAQLTDHYGDSNPHAGTHGNSALSCDHCHTDGKTVPTDEHNMCLNCHAWPRDDESYLEYMDLD